MPEAGAITTCENERAVFVLGRSYLHGLNIALYVDMLAHAFDEMIFEAV